MFIKITGYDVEIEEGENEQMPEETASELFETYILSKIMLKVCELSIIIIMYLNFF